jgi:hypothetical protein
MSQSELLIRVVGVLDAAGIPYMLTGSYASSLQGEPRLTHDIDLVVAMKPSDAAALASAFRLPNFYLDADLIGEAIAYRSQFNLLDNRSGDKVDFWILTEEPFDQARFARRYVQAFRGQSIFVSRADDTILMKLRWLQLAGGSEKQFGDALSVYEIQRALIDLDYMDHWARELGVVELWERVRREGDLDAL